VFNFKKWRVRKTHEDNFLEVTSKKFSWSLWEKICRQKSQKTFRASLRKFGQKSLAPPNLYLLLHLWFVTRHCSSASILFKLYCFSAEVNLMCPCTFHSGKTTTQFLTNVVLFPAARRSVHERSSTHPSV